MRRSLLRGRSLFRGGKRLGPRGSRCRRAVLERLESRDLLATLAINAGGPTVGDFVADQFFSGGGAFGPNNPSISPIDVSGAADPAPVDVYRTERTGQNGVGDFSYTIPNLLAGEQYELRLHFAEIFFESADARVFDVRVNGDAAPVLDDYDVFVESGDQGDASERVVIEEFTVTANTLGQLRLDFEAVTNNAKLSALELTGDFAGEAGPVFERVADSPINVFEGQGAAAGDRLYLIGGFIDNLDVTRESFAYDPAADAWAPIADFPAITEEIVNQDGSTTGQFVTGGITHGASAADGESIYVVGGYVGQSPGQATAVVSVYDTRLDEWTRGTSLPAPRGGGGAAIVDRQLHYFGGGTRTFGEDPIFDQPEHWVLDLGPTDSPDDDAAEWVRLADLPTLRNHTAGAAIDGVVYAIGGQSGGNETTGNQVALEAFDPATGQWSPRADLPLPLGHLMTSTAVVDGQLVVVSGVTNEGNPAGQNGTRRTATVLSYDPRRDAWRTLEPLPGERQSPVVGLVGDRLIVASGLSSGGREFTTFSADVDRLLAEPPRVLFVRGADRSGGFLEAGNDFSRTEQLADIFNASTSSGNHGWAELRETLEGAGFAVEQITESVEAGAATGPTVGVHIDFETLDLTQYDAIVFGSNNAVYDTAAVDAVEAYVRGGGSTLFISDANFGGDWADASDSDQQFLDRFGLIMHQDQGTYQLARGDGDFAVPDHPILTGVNRFDGEGVTPIELGAPTEGVTPTLIVGAQGQTRLNEPPFGGNRQGPSRASDPAIDGVLVVATADAGKVVGHYDRNTFFNQNGAGTNINRFDNRQYALNLFGFLVGAFDPLPGDYDGSGVVDAQDYTAWRDAFGQTGPNAADGNGDGVVDVADYTVWRDNLGTRRPELNLVAPAVAAAAVGPAADEPPPQLILVNASPNRSSPVDSAPVRDADASPAADNTLLYHALATFEPAPAALDGFAAVSNAEVVADEEGPGRLPEIDRVFTDWLNG